jgi:hypothetical protein
MNDVEAVERLARQMHWLKVYCMAVTAVLLVVLLSAAAERAQPGELSVERLNIVDASGRTRVVVSNAERFPPVLLAGKSYQRAINPAGLVFYDSAGNEVGGLALSESGAGKLSALVYDYSNSDAVGMLTRVSADGKDAMAGVVVNSRPDSALDALQAGKVARQRIALQNRNETAELVLADPEGRPRLRLQVGPDGEPRIEMLDAEGKLLTPGK